MGMDDLTYSIYNKAIMDPGYENIETLVEHLKKITEEKGIPLKLSEAFYSTIMAHGRPKYIKSSYF
jgi:hypothetical protein